MNGDKYDSGSGDARSGDASSNCILMLWLQPCAEVPALATPSEAASAEACISAVSCVLGRRWPMTDAAVDSAAAAQN